MYSYCHETFTIESQYLYDDAIKFAMWQRLGRDATQGLQCLAIVTQGSIVGYLLR